MIRKTWKRHDKREVWRAIQNTQASGVSRRALLKSVAVDLDLTYERVRQVWHLFQTQTTVVDENGLMG